MPTEFPTFAMAALAGIGSMPDTITDRGVNITMRRRTNTERVSQFRARRDGPILESMRHKLHAWGAANLEVLAKAEPEMPVEDRAADTWEPLIAVADVAGGHWPTTARAACRALVERAGESDEDQSLAVKMLSDIRGIFADRCTPFLASGDLVGELRRIEESPWSDFDLNPSKLAFRLKNFGIKPQRNRVAQACGLQPGGAVGRFQASNRQAAQTRRAARGRRKPSQPLTRLTPQPVRPTLPVRPKYLLNHCLLTL